MKRTFRGLLLAVAMAPLFFARMSNADVISWGDSLTAGVGGDGVSYVNVLAGLLAKDGYPGKVRNAGVGGESSVTIAARAGAKPLSMRPVSGMIPESGRVEVLLDALADAMPKPLLQGNFYDAGKYYGELSGVQGELVIEPKSKRYFFIRLRSGPAVHIKESTPFKTYFSEDRLSDIKIIWVGQNDPAWVVVDSFASKDQLRRANTLRAIEDAKAIAKTAGNGKYLVMSRVSADYDLRPYEDMWREAFGEHYVSARAYMVKNGLKQAGLTPTNQDLEEIKAGVVPSSLRSDDVHWNSKAYAVLGRHLYDVTKGLGWFDNDQALTK